MTKASTERYWERRHLQVKAKEIKSAEAYEKALQPELNGLYRELHAEMEKWYVKYANNRAMTKEEAVEDLAGVNSENWGMTLERFERNAKKGRRTERLDEEYYRSRVARLQDLEEQLRQVSQPYASRETGNMRDGLAKQFEDTYMRTNYTVQASKGNFTANFAHFNEAQLRMVVSNPWGKDGKDFSKRIWKNYQQDLPKMLRESVLTSTLMGYSPQKASQLFHAKFQDFKKSNLHRLVTSEMGHIAEEAAAKGYEENEIEQYEYMATLESHTCDTCGRLDGQKFKLSERKDGINYPLIHPYCRCTTVPYMDDLPEITERWSRDPTTGKGKMVKDVKFNEWKDQYAGNKLLGAFVSQSLKNNLDSNSIGAINSKLGQSLVPIQTMWKKYAPDFIIEKMVKEGSSYFMPSTGKVTFNTNHIHPTSSEWFRNDNDVIFHEFGHAIDSFSGKISLKEEFNFKKALNDDFRSLIEQKITQKISEIKSVGLTSTRKLVWDPSTSQGKYNGEKILFDTKSGELNKSSVRKIVYKELRESSSLYDDSGHPEKARAFGDVSDMIDAASVVDNPDEEIWITMGHGKEYYKRPGAQEAEALAEITSAIINNPESLDEIRKIFPTAYASYLKIVDKINEV
ncbi:minor capsid protein [Levilactobacillus angrenensis]|uniref:Minor capsid protein n=1 Tax=Levilactobacillus angrenensis TaxID=2486020 RepID=A0ABW1UDI6_9LACO|nr:minor capsid protein [Levilactobacillus angrenensis]